MNLLTRMIAIVVLASALAAPLTGEQPAAPAPLWHLEGEARGIPDVDESSVFFLGKRHEVVSIARDSGRLQWRAETGEPGDGTSGSRVVVADDTVVAGDYNLIGFDKRTGALRWRFAPRDGYAAGTYLGSVDNNVAFTGSPAGRVYAVDASSGALKWSSLVTTNAATTVFDPIASRGSIFAGFTTNVAPATGGLVALDAGSGAIRWVAKLPEPSSPFSQSNWAGGLVLADDLVIASAGDGRIHAFDVVSGTLRWSLPKLGGDIRSIVPPSDRDHRVLAYARGILIAGSVTGYVVAFDIATQRERWRHAGGLDGSTAFLFSSDARSVFVPYVSGMVVALDLETGRERWRMGDYQVGFMWPPTVQGDQLFIGATRTGFHAFRIQDH